MQCWSFSLPAGFSCPMAKYGEGTICGACYAQINRYNMPNVLRAQLIRMEYVRAGLQSTEATQALVTTLVTAISTHVKNGYFRWFDSGDFFHWKFINVCYQVCRALPDIQFWFPTRSWPHSKALPEEWIINLTLLASLPNVVVRPSALKFDDPAPEVDFLSLGSTAHTKVGGVVADHLECPKTIHGGNCESNGCRSCWVADKPVSYLVHGFLGKHVPANAKSEKIVETRKRIKQQVLNQLTVNGNRL